MEPSVIIVDGHGRLHPDRYGSACLLGQQLSIPTIGVGKNILFLGQDHSFVLKQIQCQEKGDLCYLKGLDGFEYGAVTSFLH